MSPEDVIAALNPAIRGWAYYHRHISASQTFHKVDHEIWAALWRWAVKRHPNKSKSWTKKKYFLRLGSRDWIFGVKTGKAYADGRPEVKTLQLASSISIRRHTSIRGKANPYDPEWETYFEQRNTMLMTSSVLGTRKLAYLWRSQKGLCPMCGQMITKDTKWVTHFVVPKTEGGTPKWSNLMMLHQECHRQLHGGRGKVE
jgi:RNA-directed DNA polymerase